MLKYQLDTLNEVPAELAAHYEEADDGAFVLRVEGMVPKRRLDEFRDNNIKLARERDELAKALDGARTEEVEKIVHERTAEIQARLNRTLLERAIAELAARHDVRKEAVPDLTLRAQGVWTIDEHGALAPRPAADGEALYDRHGDRPLTPETWLSELRTSAPHYFATSNGGGAPGGSASGGFPRRVLAKEELKTAKDKSDYIAEHGLDAFTNLPLRRA